MFVALESWNPGPASTFESFAYFVGVANLVLVFVSLKFRET